MADSPQVPRYAQLDEAFRPPEWAYFAEAVAWHSSGIGLTDGQVFDVIKAIRDALVSGRITPGDLGFHQLFPNGSTWFQTYWQAPGDHEDKR